MNLEQIEMNTELMTGWLQQINQNGYAAGLLVAVESHEDGLQSLRIYTHAPHETVIKIIDDLKKMMDEQEFERLNEKIDRKN